MAGPQISATIDTKAVKARLAAIAKRYSNVRPAIVEYGNEEVDYAIYVHEDLTANHPRGGQAKFLSTPMRRNRAKYTSLARKVATDTGSLSAGLLAAAFQLLEDSQPLVPVDTGALKKSGRAYLGRNR